MDCRVFFGRLGRGIVKFELQDLGLWAAANGVYMYLDGFKQHPKRGQQLAALSVPVCHCKLYKL